MNNNFEQAMANGVALQLKGNHEAALESRREAYFIAEPDSIEQGRAARDMSASFDRLNQPENAWTYALEAAAIHGNLAIADVEDMSVRRELGASQIYAGAIGLRSTIVIELETGDIDTQKADSSIHMFTDANKNLEKTETHRPDQYRINGVRRWALAEGLYGKAIRGLYLGVKAGALATISESPLFVQNAAQEMKIYEKLKVRARGVAGSAVAVAVSALGVFEPVKKRTRRLALMLANKAL